MANNFDEARRAPANDLTLHKVEDGLRTMMEKMGEDPARDGLKDTPVRILGALYELTWGLRVEEETFFDSITKEFELAHDQMVVVKDIEFTSLCEHHWLPIVGKATVAYIPGDSDRVLGISKLARLVRYYAARPQVQERMTTQIGDALKRLVSPMGVGVYVAAEHMCMTIRGVHAPGSLTITSDLRGAFRDSEARHEFLALARNER